MKKLSLFSILLCSFVVLFILGSCSLTVQDYDSASLEIRLPVSNAASQGRALVSTEGSVYLCLIREDGGGGLYGPLSPVNGRVQIADVEPGDYIDILVVHTTKDIDIDGVFTYEGAFSYHEQYGEVYKDYLESYLAAVIDGHGSIGWTGAKTLSPGSNNLGTLTLRPLCHTVEPLELDGVTLTIANDTKLPRFYQLTLFDSFEKKEYQLSVEKVDGLSFELYNAKGEIIDKGDSEFWTIPQNTETLFLLVSGSLGENGASIQVSFGPPSIDFGVDLDTDPVISVEVDGEEVGTKNWTIYLGNYEETYTLSVDGYENATFKWQINGEKVSGEKTSTFTFKPSDYVNSLRPGTNTITLVVTVANGDMYSAFVEFTLSDVVTVANGDMYSAFVEFTLSE